jgi:hypothetical protein
MAPHLTSKEQDMVRQLNGQGKDPQSILSKLNSQRNAKGVARLAVDAVRRCLRGKTHLRGKPEARGKKPVLTKHMVLKLNRVRKNLVKECNGEKRVLWKDVLKKARARRVHSSTVQRSFQREGLDVRSRPCRSKPMRGKEQEKERMEKCRQWRFLQSDCFTDKVDMIIDNKKFEVPTTARAQAYVKKQKVHSQLRTKAEGLKPGFTRPNTKKQRMRAGGYASVCAGISGGKVVFWHCLGPA